MKIAREALPWVTVLLVVSAGAWLLHPIAAAAGLLLAAFVVWFFRDPERTPPDREGVLISPADGRIIKAGPETISVFMNVFNVHVCRTPVGGVIEELEHRAGKFLAAYHDTASEQNERVAIVVADGERRCRFTLVAGLVARRIVPKVERGQRVCAGERIGLIQFGSRVDVDLPAGFAAEVAIGDHVVAGETIIASDSAGAPVRSAG